MAQARVTDYFSQRKNRVRGAAKPAGKQRPAARFSSPVHEEFVRVIDEAAGLSKTEEFVSTKPDQEEPSRPRTPKRNSADAEFDLGAAVFSVTAEHSSVKKRRQAGGVIAAESNEKTTTTTTTNKRRTARKKLVLPEEKPQVLGQEDLTALKSRLQTIRKRAEDSSVSSAPHSSSSSSPTTSINAAPSGPATELQALRFSMARAKELAAKAQRRKEERGAEEAKPTETQTPEGTGLPGYQRYHTLAQAVPPGLTLPYHYKILTEMFRNMDTVVAMLYNRSETATFTKIKQGVQDMMHKRFEESHVGQIKTVFPEAYEFKQEKNVPTFNSNISKGSYQLTVEPLLRSDQNEARPALSAARLLERRQIFHQNLVSIVKQHHKAFLSSLVPAVSVPEDKLTRWHPRFNVDSVAAITASSLPRGPRSEKVSTAQEVLEKARSLITPKMEKALVSVARKAEEKNGEGTKPGCTQNPTVPATPASAPAQVPSALKGVSQSLLDRIRAKEVQKLQAAMTRNPAQEERLLMMSRLGELARILRNVFVSEKKAALTMEVACNRMVASYRSALSPGDMEKHVRLLAEVAPDWLSVHLVRKDFYLKLNKSEELSIVLDKLNRRLKEEEKL